MGPEDDSGRTSGPWLLCLRTSSKLPSCPRGAQGSPLMCLPSPGASPATGTAEGELAGAPPGRRHCGRLWRRLCSRAHTRAPWWWPVAGCAPPESLVPGAAAGRSVRACGPFPAVQPGVALVEGEPEGSAGGLWPRNTDVQKLPRVLWESCGVLARTRCGVGCTLPESWQPCSWLHLWPWPGHASASLFPAGAAGVGGQSQLRGNWPMGPDQCWGPCLHPPELWGMGTGWRVQPLSTGTRATGQFVPGAEIQDLSFQGLSLGLSTPCSLALARTRWGS